MPRVFNRPVERQAHTAFRGQTSNQRAGVRERRLLGGKARVMDEPRQTFASCLEVVKEAGESGLAARPHHQKCDHMVGDGFLLMPVCRRQNEADILGKASGQRVLCHRKPMLS